MVVVLLFRKAFIYISRKKWRKIGQIGEIRNLAKWQIRIVTNRHKINFEISSTMGRENERKKKSIFPSKSRQMKEKMEFREKNVKISWYYEFDI